MCKSERVQCLFCNFSFNLAWKQMDLSTEKIIQEIREILKGANLDNLSSRKVRQQIENKFHVDLSNQKKFIDTLLMEQVNKEREERNKKTDTSSEECEEDENDEEEDVPKPPVNSQRQKFSFSESNAAEEGDEEEEEVTTEDSHLSSQNVDVDTSVMDWVNEQEASTRLSDRSSAEQDGEEDVDEDYMEEEEEDIPTPPKNKRKKICDSKLNITTEEGSLSPGPKRKCRGKKKATEPSPTKPVRRSYAKPGPRCKKPPDYNSGSETQEEEEEEEEEEGNEEPITEPAPKSKETPNSDSGNGSEGTCCAQDPDDYAITTLNEDFKEACYELFIYSIFPDYEVPEPTRHNDYLMKAQLSNAHGVAVLGQLVNVAHGTNCTCCVPIDEILGSRVDHLQNMTTEPVTNKRISKWGLVLIWKIMRNPSVVEALDQMRKEAFSIMTYNFEDCNAPEVYDSESDSDGGKCLHAITLPKLKKPPKSEFEISVELPFLRRRWTTLLPPSLSSADVLFLVSYMQSLGKALPVACQQCSAISRSWSENYKLREARCVRSSVEQTLRFVGYFS